MATYVLAILRRAVRQDAAGRCAYCLTSERLVGLAHEIEHVVPEAAGGTTERDNLCLACRRCNAFKARRIDAVDPLSQNTVALFHPRQMVWNEHFRWDFGGTRVIGRTPTGRATVEALQLNHPLILQARILWVRAGLHPPK